MKYLLLSILVFVSLSWGDKLRDLALSKGLAPIPADFNTLKSQVDDRQNPMSIPKIILGKKLFFDKNFSKDRTNASVSFHNITKGGEDSITTSIG